MLYHLEFLLPSNFSVDEAAPKHPVGLECSNFIQIDIATRSIAMQLAYKVDWRDKLATTQLAVPDVDCWLLKYVFSAYKKMLNTIYNKRI